MRNNGNGALRSVDAKELAVVARGMLKSAFPGVKFSVRSDYFSMGSAVRVGWTDGPPEPAVDALLASLRGKSFDGTDDSTHYNSVTLPSGEEVSASAWVTSSRRVTDELCARMKAVFARATGHAFESPAFRVYGSNYLHRLAYHFDATRGVFMVKDCGDAVEIAEGETSPPIVSALRSTMDSFGELWKDIRRAEAESAVRA